MDATMKNYLNQNERSNVVMLCALIGFVKEEMLIPWDERNNLTTDEKRNLKTSITLLTKVYDSIKGRLDSKFSNQLARDAKATNIFCLPKDVAERKIQQYQENMKTETAEVSIEAITALAGKALDWCNPCDKTDHKNCMLKEIFLELTIPPYDPETDECPYKIKGRESDMVEPRLLRAL